MSYTSESDDYVSPYLRRPLRTLERARWEIAHPYHCPHCKRRFMRPRDLEQHQAMKHGDAA